MANRTLTWTRNGDQRIAKGVHAEYRITEWIAGNGSTWSLAIIRSGRISDGGAYSTLSRAKEVAYSLDLRG